MTNDQFLKEEALRMVRLFACDAENQIKSFPSFVVFADEIALDNDDLVARLKVNEQIDLPPLVRTFLIEADKKLGELSDLHDHNVWTPEALASHPVWTALRDEARTVAKQVGLSFDSPVPNPNSTYIQ